MLGERLGGRLRSGLVTPAQSGQVLVFTALFMVAMLAFTGLALDVGHEMDRYREAQNSADAAALAAADSINLGANLPLATAEQQAQNEANLVMQQNGLGGSETLTLTYLDANKQPATFTLPTDIAYVRAKVSDSFPTFFIRVLGINNTNVGAQAVAKVQWKPMCELCVLDHTVNGALSLTGGGGFTGQNIRIIDNSNYPNTALVASGGGTISDTGPDAQIYVVGGYSYPAGAVNPTPVSGIPPIPDPLAWIPVPSNIPPGSCVQGSHPGSAYDACSNGTPPSVAVDSSYKDPTATINPGVFNTIKVTSNKTLYLNPGIYVITGPFSVDSGSTVSVTTSTLGNVQGYGVMLYLDCATNQAPYYMITSSSQGCPALQLQQNGTYKSPVSQNQMGSLGFAGGATVVLWGPNSAQAALCPATDTIDNDSANDACPSADAYANQPAYVPSQYTGMLIYQDRTNTDTMSLAGTSSNGPPPGSCTSAGSNTSCIADTIYGKSAAIQITGGGTQATAFQSYVIADTVSFTGNGGTGGAGTFAMSFPVGVNAPLSIMNGLVE